MLLREWDVKVSEVLRDTQTPKTNCKFKLKTNTYVNPAPRVCPTALPTATPAAVVAICANIPGCLGAAPWGTAGGAAWTGAGGWAEVVAGRDWVR